MARPAPERENTQGVSEGMGSEQNLLLRCTLMALCLLLLLTGCGAVKEFVDEQAAGDDAGKIAAEDDTYVRTPPPVAMPAFSDAPAYYNDDGVQNCTVDVSNLSKGYVGVRYNSPGEDTGRFRVQTGDYTYNYILKPDGSDQFFPLAMGSGQYDFSVFAHIEGESYTPLLNGSEYAELESEQAPFLYPNGIVSYTPDSYAVTQGYEIGQHAKTDLEFVQAIYAWVRDNVTYDKQKAVDVQQNLEYAPDVDDTMRDKTGICYDYAAMTAAIFRSNGIPTKLIKGQVDTGDGKMIAHAWNMIWLEEEGWITVSIPTTPEEWQRIDLTFAAALGKGPNEYVGDGTDYVDISVH